MSDLDICQDGVKGLNIVKSPVPDLRVDYQPSMLICGSEYVETALKTSCYVTRYVRDGPNRPIRNRIPGLIQKMELLEVIENDTCGSFNNFFWNFQA